MTPKQSIVNTNNDMATVYTHLGIGSFFIFHDVSKMRHATLFAESKSISFQVRSNKPIENPNLCA